MTDNINTRPPAVNIPETPAEERSEYISDARLYDERELAFFKICDEVNKRSIAEMDESIARDREFIARGRESLAKLDALIAELKGKQNSK